MCSMAGQAEEQPCLALFYAVIEPTEMQKEDPHIQAAYKHVDNKVKSVAGTMPEESQVICQFPENPLHRFLSSCQSFLTSFRLQN